MTARIAKDGFCGAAARCSRGHGPGRNEPQRREPGSRKIDEVIETCGGPPESKMAAAPMADHAVGGIDRLIERSTGEPGNEQPKDWSDDAIG